MPLGLSAVSVSSQSPEADRAASDIQHHTQAKGRIAAFRRERRPASTEVLVRSCNEFTGPRSIGKDSFPSRFGRQPCTGAT